MQYFYEILYYMYNVMFLICNIFIFCKIFIRGEGYGIGLFYKNPIQLSLT